MSPPRILSILRARQRLVLGPMFGLMLATLAVSLASPQRYVAETQLVIGAQSADPVPGLFLPPGTATNPMITQLDIIGSDRVAQRVIKRLKLDQDPAIREQWQTQTGGKGSLDAWYGRILKRHLSVVSNRESNVVTLGYAGNAARQAADIANAFAQAYIDTHLELQAEPARPSAVTVLTVATEPAQPSNPEWGLTAALGLLCGGLLGAGLALWLEWFGPRLRSAADMAETLGVPVLAVLPPARQARGKA